VNYSEKQSDDPGAASPLEPQSAEAASNLRPDWAGLIGVAATAALNFAFMEAGPRSSPAFIAGTCVFWVLFVIVRVSRDKRILRTWGFRADNLWEAALIPAAVFALGVAGCGAYGFWYGTLHFPGHALVLLLLYPVWGVIQQFLVLGVVVGNLERLRILRARKPLLILIGAILFGLVHAYDPRLVPVTFLLELLIIPLYFKDRNLWPLGVLHGWLGVFVYLWVLNRDLWIEYFG
jgi:hypothetical protein